MSARTLLRMSKALITPKEQLIPLIWFKNGYMTYQGFSVKIIYTYRNNGTVETSIIKGEASP